MAIVISLRRLTDDKTTIKRLAILTSGGDAPGMNAAIRSDDARPVPPVMLTALVTTMAR
jgi:hypothetical protein